MCVTLDLFLCGVSGATLAGTEQEKPALAQAAFCRAALYLSSSAWRLNSQPLNASVLTLLL